MPPAADLLFDLLRWDGPHCSPSTLRGLRPATWAELADLAHAQNLAPLLLQRLRAHNLADLPPRELLARLGAASSTAALRGRQAYQDLANIAAIAGELGAPLVVLGAAALAAPVYRDLALRHVGELELLTEAADVSVLAQRLPPDSLPVTLHVALAPAGAPYRLPLEEIGPRLEPQELPGGPLPGLAPTDLLLHICADAAVRRQLRGVGIMPLCDIAQLALACAEQLDWPALAERAQQWGCRRGVALALALAHELLGAAVPAAALAALGAAEIDAALLSAARRQLFAAPAAKQPAPTGLLPRLQALFRRRQAEEPDLVAEWLED